MAKGGSSGGSMSNGGIGGSGIFGMFGTVVQCKADDTSLYCSLAKLINTIFMIFVLGIIIYFIWTLIRGNSQTGSMSGGYISRSSKGKSKK